jgi:hypothetical protein
LWVLIPSTYLEKERRRKIKQNKLDGHRKQKIKSSKMMPNGKRLDVDLKP